MFALTVTLLMTTPAPTPGAAPAVSAAERIARGERALENLDYDVAADELTAAAVQDDASDEQRVRAHLLAGVANRVLGRDLEARVSFRYVLMRAPATALPEGTAPKVTTFYEIVRQELTAERDTAVGNPPPAGGEPPRFGPAQGTDGSSQTIEAASGPLAQVEQAKGPSVPWLTAGGGALAAVVGGATLAVAELYLADPSQPGEERAQVQAVGVVGVVLIGVGVAVAGAGATWAWSGG